MSFSTVARQAGMATLHRLPVVNLITASLAHAMAKDRFDNALKKSDGGGAENHVDDWWDTEEKLTSAVGGNIAGAVMFGVGHYFSKALGAPELGHGLEAGGAAFAGLFMRVPVQRIATACKDRLDQFSFREAARQGGGIALKTVPGINLLPHALRFWHAYSQHQAAQQGGSEELVLARPALSAAFRQSKGRLGVAVLGNLCGAKAVAFAEESFRAARHLAHSSAHPAAVLSVAAAGVAVAALSGFLPGNESARRLATEAWQGTRSAFSRQHVEEWIGRLPFRRPAEARSDLLSLNLSHTHTRA